MRRVYLAILMAVLLAAAPEPAAAWHEWSAYYTSSDAIGQTSFEMAPGETREVVLRFDNEGSYQWRGGEPGWRYVSLYATQPYARKSVFAAASWHSSVQPAMLTESRVLPGQRGTFRFEVTAPSMPGTYEENFQLAVEDTTWVWNGAVTLHITVDADAGLEQARASLRSVLALRGDLRSLFADDWSARPVPETDGISDLEDWARQYGYREHPSLLSWYAPARQTVTVATVP